MWLKHESGEATELRNSQVLGDDSPLEFDEDGYAEVDDERGRMLLTMHRHVERGGHGPPGAAENDAEAEDADSEDDELEEFDADAFVDRTPMDDVVDDIESGDYDEHLEAIEAAADRNGVLDAVDARRE